MSVLNRWDGQKGALANGRSVSVRDRRKQYEQAPPSKPVSPFLAEIVSGEDAPEDNPQMGPTRSLSARARIVAAETAEAPPPRLQQVHRVSSSKGSGLSSGSLQELPRLRRIASSLPARQNQANLTPGRRRSNASFIGASRNGVKPEELGKSRLEGSLTKKESGYISRQLSDVSADTLTTGSGRPCSRCCIMEDKVLEMREVIRAQSRELAAKRAEVAFVLSTSQRKSISSWFGLKHSAEVELLREEVEMLKMTNEFLFQELQASRSVADGDSHAQTSR